MKIDIEIDDLNFGDVNLHAMRSKIEAAIDKAVKKAVQKVMAEHPVFKALVQLARIMHGPRKMDEKIIFSMH